MFDKDQPKQLMMNTSNNDNLGSLEGRKFIIGREGHIYVSDPAASKEHAEIEIIGGRILIRDLNSTNGIYFVNNNKAVRFKEEYVLPDQTIAIGQERHTVKNLLSIIGDFAG